MGRGVTVCVFLSVSMLLAGCGNSYEEAVMSLESGDYEAAVTQFGAAIEEERNVGDSYRGAALAHWELGNYEQAAAAMEAAFEYGSSLERTGTDYHFLGACKMRLGDWSGAIGYYEQGLQKDDCTDEMIQEMKFNIIAAYENLGDFETAKVKLAEYVAQYPEDETAAKEAEFFKIS